MSPKGHSSATATAPSPCTASMATTKASHATSASPAKRPPSSVKLPSGRASSTSAMRSRASRARTSKARKTMATTITQSRRTPMLERMKRGLTRPTLAESPDTRPWMPE